LEIYKMNKLIILLVLTSICGISSQLPRWPMTWTVNFQSLSFGNDTSLSISQVSTGTFWYDATQNSMRQDFDNSEADGICASVYNYTGTCSMIFNQKGLYLNYPDMESCCFCCTAQTGCAALSPNWMNSDGHSQGSEMINGVMCNKYEVTGFNQNYFWMTTDNIPCALNNGGSQLFLYDQSSYSTNSIPSYTFQVQNCNFLCPGDFCGNGK